MIPRLFQRLFLLAAAFLPFAAAAEPARTTAVDWRVGQMAQAPIQAPIQTHPSSDWTAEKCRRYRIAWSQLMQRRGRTGLSDDFVASHDAFIARDCQDPRNVCPRSAAELDVANVMTIAAMNAGTASTFPPFACRRTGG